MEDIEEFYIPETNFDDEAPIYSTLEVERDEVLERIREKEYWDSLYDEYEATKYE